MASADPQLSLNKPSPDLPGNIITETRFHLAHGVNIDQCSGIIDHQPNMGVPQFRTETFQPEESCLQFQAIDVEFHLPPVGVPRVAPHPVFEASV